MMWDRNAVLAFGRGSFWGWFLFCIRRFRGSGCFDSRALGGRGEQVADRQRLVFPPINGEASLNAGVLGGYVIGGAGYRTLRSLAIGKTRPSCRSDQSSQTWMPSKAGVSRPEPCRRSFFFVDRAAEKGICRKCLDFARGVFFSSRWERQGCL